VVRSKNAATTSSAGIMIMKEIARLIFVLAVLKKRRPPKGRPALSEDSALEAG
jgi:hypothetical protein